MSTPLFKLRGVRIFEHLNDMHSGDPRMLLAHEFQTLSNDALARTIEQSHQRMNTNEAAFVMALADFHARDLARDHGAPNTVVWAVRHLNVAESTVYQYLRVGRALHSYHQVANAYLAGEITYSVVRALEKYLAPHNEAELLDLAMSMTLSELRQALAGTADRPEKPPVEGLNFHIDDNTGWLRFNGQLNPENGARFLAALKVAELASLRDLGDIDPEVLADPEQLDDELRRATDTPVEVDAELVESPVVDSSGGKVDPRTKTGYGVPLRDNLLGSFLSMINMTRTTPTNKLRTPGAQVNVLVSEDGRALLPQIPQAATSDLIAAALGGDVRMHLLDKKGVHLAASKPQRLVSDAQAGAILVRWHHQCAMPGCNHAMFIEFHHIITYAEGGETATWNIIPVCSACHALITAHRAVVEFDPDDASRLLFKFRNGVVFASANRSLPMRLHEGQFRTEEEVLSLQGGFLFRRRGLCHGTIRGTGFFCRKVVVKRPHMG